NQDSRDTRFYACAKSAPYFWVEDHLCYPLLRNLEQDSCHLESLSCHHFGAIPAEHAQIRAAELLLPRRQRAADCYHLECDQTLAAVGILHRCPSLGAAG